MDRIDFVPEDYVQLKESHRANFFYLAIVAIIILGVSGAFGVIKVRQEAIAKEARAVDKRTEEVQQSIKQLEILQGQRQEMMKTALLAAELIEPVPRSIITAFLTNALPENISLTSIKIMQNKLQTPAGVAPNQYEAAKAAAEQKPQRQEYITTIELEGLAVNDIEVADYIASLSAPVLLTNVCLVHSMQKEINNTTYRQFKLTAQLRSNLTITNDLVEKIRNYKPIESGE